MRFFRYSFTTKKTLKPTNSLRRLRCFPSCVVLSKCQNAPKRFLKGSKKLLVTFIKSVRTRFTPRNHSSEPNIQFVTTSKKFTTFKLSLTTKKHRHINSPMHRNGKLANTYFTILIKITLISLRKLTFANPLSSILRSLMVSVTTNSIRNTTIHYKVSRNSLLHR